MKIVHVPLLEIVLTPKVWVQVFDVGSKPYCKVLFYVESNHSPIETVYFLKGKDLHAKIEFHAEILTLKFRSRPESTEKGA